MEGELSIIGNKYQIGKRIGGGSFGQIFEVIDTESQKHYAAKLEHISHKSPQVINEAKLLKSLGSLEGIPRVRWYGVQSRFNVMVMELLGKSLEELFNSCRRRFSIKTCLMLALQFLELIEAIHKKDVIHRDIKPENYVMGINKKTHLVYMIDFGLSKRFRDRVTTLHIPFKENRNLVGTARYASINNHIGVEQSRRDDLESIGYVLIYFAKGNLPWQGNNPTNKHQKYHKIMETKLRTSVGELCRGLPQEFQNYINYCRNLSFNSNPDYEYLKGLFKTVAAKFQIGMDKIYDWSEDPKPKSKKLESRKVKRTKKKKSTLEVPETNKKSSSVVNTCNLGKWPEFKDVTKIRLELEKLKTRDKLEVTPDEKPSCTLF